MDDEIEEVMVVEDDNHHIRPTPTPRAYEMLKDAQASAEEIVSRILTVKKEGLPKPQLRELVTQMFLNFVAFRQTITKVWSQLLHMRMFLQISPHKPQRLSTTRTLANTGQPLKEDRVKAETERAKAPVDFTTLQLHNFMYEKNHYVKAIKACRDIKFKYPDIELIPKEEFLRDAPQEIKCLTASDDAHKLMTEVEF